MARRTSKTTNIKKKESNLTDGGSGLFRSLIISTQLCFCRLGPQFLGTLGLYLSPCSPIFELI